MSDEKIGQSEVRVAELVETFLELTRAGKAPGREAFVAGHPDLADALREALGGLELVEGMARHVSAAEVGDETAPSLKGQSLGDYCIAREIGRGGMGVVYEAEDQTLQRRVALKVLPAASLLDPKRLQRFRHEAQAAAQLHHTNIVPVYGVGSDRGTHYYAMQYIEGINLAQAIGELKATAGGEGNGKARTATPSPLSSHGSHRSRSYLRAACRIGIQAAEGLDYAHQVGVVHRDIKPANIMLDASGHVWIMDFGLAQFEQGTHLTQTGDLVGTFRYMSPEQALAKRVPIDHRTDVYSLGASLYELATLEPAVQGDDPQTVLQSISFKDPVAPRKRNPSVPPELETILLKAMAKDPAERYETAQELADDLRRFLDDRPIVAKPPSMAQRGVKWVRRHKGLVGAAMLVLTVATALLAVSNMRVRGALDDAEANLRLARRAVDQFLAGVGIDSLDVDPVPSQERQALLTQALRFYDRYLGQSGSAKDHDHRGNILKLLGRHEEALLAFDRALAIDPAMSGALANKASSLALLGRHEEALAASRRALQLNPNELAHFSHARALTGLKRYDEAVAAYSRALELNPDNWIALSNRGSLFCNYLKRYSDALEDFDTALKHAPREPTLHYNRGNTLGRLKRFSEALAAFDRALILDPGELKGSLGRADALYRLGRDTESLTVYDQISERNPESRTHHDRGIIFFRLRRYEDAVKAHDRAIALDPKNGWIHNSRGAALYRLKRYDDALAAFTRATELAPSLAMAHHNLGDLLLYQLNRAEDALDSFTRAIEIEPENAKAHYGQGGALLFLKQYEKALAALQRSCELSPTSFQAHNNRGLCLMRLEMFEEASQAFDRALQLNPRLRQAHVNRGEALWQRGRHKEALRVWESSIALGIKGLANDVAWKRATSADPELRDPARAVALAERAVRQSAKAWYCWNTLGVAHYAAGDSIKALTALDKSMQLRGGGDGNDWFFVAMAKHKLGQKDAREWYDKAVVWMDKNKPDDEELKRFRAEAEEVLGIKTK